MVKLIIQDKEIITQPGETVLESLLREGFTVPYGCRQGACYSCILYSDIAPPELAQQGLSNEQKQQNGLFACLCVPQHDMVIRFADSTKTALEQ